MTSDQLDSENLNINGIQQYVWDLFEDSDGVFVIIKTEFDKIIAVFIPTKFEMTQGCDYELNSFSYINGKVINDCIIFYCQEKQLV